MFYVFPRTDRHVCYTRTTILIGGLDVARIGTLRQRPVVTIAIFEHRMFNITIEINNSDTRKTNKSVNPIKMVNTNDPTIRKGDSHHSPSQMGRTANEQKAQTSPSPRVKQTKLREKSRSSTNRFKILVPNENTDGNLNADLNDNRVTNIGMKMKQILARQLNLAL